MTAAFVVAALGTLCFVGVAGTRSVLFVVLGLMVLGLGMGAVTTPATALLVSGLPPEQAGVGSAMNDVTREFGSAFGIAVLGSVLALRYSSLVKVTGLSASTARTARNGIGGALQVARTVHPAAAARTLRVSADAAFTSGFRLAVVVGALVLAGLAALTWAKLPRTAGAGVPSLPDPATQPTG